MEKSEESGITLRWLERAAGLTIVGACRESATGLASLATGDAQARTQAAAEQAYFEARRLAVCGGNQPPVLPATCCANRRNKGGGAGFRKFERLASGGSGAWLDLIEDTGQTPEGLTLSDHFLYVGRRS